MLKHGINRSWGGGGPIPVGFLSERPDVACSGIGLSQGYLQPDRFEIARQATEIFGFGPFVSGE